MNEINKNVGKRIRDIRKSKSISIEKMAEKLNISYSTYQRIENGETNSWATHLEKISSLLEVSFEEIVIDKEKFIQINNEQSTGYFKSDIIINNLSERIFFVLGAGTGTFGLVYTYAYIANRKREFVFKYLNDSRLNKLIGMIFWGLAAVQLVNLLS